MTLFWIFYLFAVPILAPKDLSPDPLVASGTTMGTTYVIKYFDEPQRRDFSASIDSLLKRVNSSISTYDPASVVSLINRNELRSVEDPLMFRLLNICQDIVAKSGGAFDPTVGPLVNAWGFGPGKPLSMDGDKVDSIRSFIGFEHVNVSDCKIRKTDPRVQLDFGGIGQGFAADLIAEFLTSKGIENMLIEIGGEGVARGSNLQSGRSWTIGIIDPESANVKQEFKAFVKLRDQAFTTSGNYFNTREIEGKKVVHTINPFTGYPEENRILSVSVFADQCATADAWATALMVVGPEVAIAKVKALTEIDAFLIFTTQEGEVQTFQSSGLDITLAEP